MEVEITSAAPQEDQPPEEALANISGETDTVSLAPSDMTTFLAEDKTPGEEKMEEGADHVVERPPAQPNLAGMIAAGHRPEETPSTQTGTLEEDLARRWNELGQPSEQDREQFIKDFSLQSPTIRAGLSRYFSYPRDIYGIPRQFSFLQRAGLCKKGRDQVCELKAQEDELLNDRIRSYLIDRPAGTPLCSLSKGIRGLMFDKPVHDRVFYHEVLKLLGIAKLQAEQYRTETGGSLDKTYMADEASATIIRLVKEVSPGSDNFLDVVKRSMVLEVGQDSTFPHRFTQFDRLSKEFFTKTETQYALDHAITENGQNPVDMFAKFVIKKILSAAECEKGRMAPWEHQFLRVIGLDSEGFLNISTRTCSRCGSQSPICTRNNLERLHMMVGSSYITILLPASRPKNIDFGQFGAHHIPETGKTEGTFTCETTTYMSRLLVPIFRLLGSNGPFLVSAFDVGSEVRAIDRAVRALGLGDALTDVSGFDYLINFIEADFYRNPMNTVVGLPTNLDANYKRGSNAQQLFVTGVCTPTDLWRNASTQGRADYHKLNPETSTALELFTYLYHKADASYPRLAVYLMLTSSLFLNVNGMVMEDTVRCEALIVCLLEQLVRVSSGHIWRLKTPMDDEYWEIVGKWIVDGKIPTAVERTCDGTKDLSTFNKKYRVGSFMNTKIEFFVPVPVEYAEEGMANMSLSHVPPPPGETEREFLDLTITEETMIIEPEVDSPLSKSASMDEVRKYIEGAITASPQEKLPPDQTAKLLRLVKNRVQTEVQSRQREARERAVRELQRQAEPFNNAILDATRVKNNSRPELAGLRTQLVELQEKISQAKRTAKEADAKRDKAQDDRQVIKARLKSELNIFAKGISQEVAARHARLTQLIVDNSDNLEAANETLAEIEKYTTIKPRKLSEEDQGKVLVPSWPRPEFIPVGEDKPWRELVALKFRVWKEAKRIQKVLLDPEIVELVLATKGKSHMDKLYLRWQKAVEGLDSNHLSWRDIRCIHIAWVVVLRTSLPPKEGNRPVPTETFKENTLEVRRISAAVHRVCLRLLEVPAETPWSMAWTDAQALNPSVACKSYNVPVETYDGEMQKWVRACSYAHVRAEAGDNVFGKMERTPGDITKEVEARQAAPVNTENSETTKKHDVSRREWADEVEEVFPNGEAPPESDQEVEVLSTQPAAKFRSRDIRSEFNDSFDKPLDNSTPKKKPLPAPGQFNRHSSRGARSESNNPRSRSRSHRGQRGGQMNQGRSNSLTKRPAATTSRGRSEDRNLRGNKGGKNASRKQNAAATSQRQPGQPTQSESAKQPRKRKRKKNGGNSLERDPKVVVTQNSVPRSSGAPKKD